MNEYKGMNEFDGFSGERAAAEEQRWRYVDVDQEELHVGDVEFDDGVNIQRRGSERESTTSLIPSDPDPDPVCIFKRALSFQSLMDGLAEKEKKTEK